MFPAAKWALKKIRGISLAVEIRASFLISLSVHWRGLASAFGVVFFLAFWNFCVFKEKARAATRASREFSSLSADYLGLFRLWIHVKSVVILRVVSWARCKPCLFALSSLHRIPMQEGVILRPISLVFISHRDQP